MVRLFTKKHIKSVEWSFLVAFLSELESEDIYLCKFMLILSAKKTILFYNSKPQY